MQHQQLTSSTARALASTGRPQHRSQSQSMAPAIVRNSAPGFQIPNLVAAEGASP
jgi:hypothetical protein